MGGDGGPVVMNFFFALMNGDGDIGQGTYMQRRRRRGQKKTVIALGWCNLGTASHLVLSAAWGVNGGNQKSQLPSKWFGLPLR